ncbi:MAG: hypothetical protein AAGM22_15010 [Acidobacteriota bacterium]
MAGWKRFFLIAGLFNLFGGTMGLLTLNRPYLEAGMPTPNYPFAFQLLLTAVLIFGVGFLMVSRDPQRHRGIVWLGLMAKSAGFVFSLWALHTGQLPESARPQPFIVDLPWAVGFALFLWRTEPAPFSSPSP